MEYVTQVKVATITLWNFLAIVVNVVAFVMLYMKANRNTSSLKAFFIVQLSMIIWLVGKVFKTVSPTEDIRWAFIVFYYFGICLLGASFLDFAYIYNRGKPMNKTIRAVIYTIGLLQFLLVYTNPYHYLFYSRYSFWGDEFGKLFYVNVVINYLFIFIGMVLCSQKFKKQIINKTRLEKNIISFAILTPLVFNFIYITRALEALCDMLKIQVFDITPIVYTWSLLIFVYATFKYEFFDLTPIMKHEITSRLDTPVLITDKEYNILYSNKKLRSIFENPVDIIHSLIKTDEDIVGYNNRFYKYDINEVYNMGDAKYIITFNDITSYQTINNALITENQALDAANKKLENQIQLLKQTSHIGARNYVARELHDIIGHSLVVTMKLLEVGKISYTKNKARAVDSLEKAKQTVKNGFDEMKKVRDKDTDVIYSTTLLDREIKTMLKTVDISGVKTNFYLRGNRKSIDEKVFDIIKKISTELVTNTLKHSGATSLFLSIVFENNEANLQLMDNGKGTKNLVKGNGLTGIDGRLSLVGGKARYTSVVGEGFNVSINIPIK